MNLWLIFFTGLTAGGLTCLTTQAGLLASALPRPATVPTLTRQQAKKWRRSKAKPHIELPKNPWPIVYFLGAKLLGYTLLGLLLGALGSIMQLTPAMQATLQIAAGLFMLATALNMLNVHPIFRYVVIQPPKALTRLVRDQAKSQEVFTPALLGFMTVFVPCGTTQTMQALAISTGSPILGALILFVFVLGTLPTFFVLGFAVTQLMNKFQHRLTLATAALVIFLSILSLNGGLNLIGSPLAPSRILTSLVQSSRRVATPASLVDGVQEAAINVYNTRYSPNYLSAQSGQPLRLRLVTKGTYGCTRAFTIPRLGMRQILPETGETLIDLPPQPPGNLYFTCSMGMYSGVITILQNET